MMQMRKGKFWATIIIVLSIFVVLLTAGPSFSAPKEVVYGAIIPLSGPAAPWGIAMRNVWAMLTDQINRTGGMTVNGEKYVWKVVAYDSAMDPSKAVSAANRLISRDKAKFISILDGGLVQAIQPITERKKVIIMALATPGKDYINPKNPFTFVYGMDAMTASVLYPWVAKNTNVKTVALLEPDNWTGKTTAKLSRDAISHTNLKIVFDEFADEAATDFYPVLTRTLASKPDFLEVANWDPGVGALLIKQARGLGFKGPMHLVTPDIPTLKEVAGWQNCENIFLDPDIVQPSRTMKIFKEDYIKTYGEKQWPGPIAYSMYDYPGWFTKAVLGTQSFDTVKIIKYMQDAKLTSIWGKPARMGGKRYFGIKRIPVYPVYIAQVQNGEVKQVINGVIPDNL
jgi:branched-chain amino acid transport system substrate-binding protein